MAGDWIKMRTSLPRDPRVIRISSALHADRLRTIGGLLSAWCLFDEQTPDGRLDGYTPDLLDELVGLPGIAKAMEMVGWLSIGDGFLEVPRFDEHNGKSAKRRAQDSVRKTSAREADKHPLSMRTECGPEKRREEKSKEREVNYTQEATRSHAIPSLAEVKAYARSGPVPISEACAVAFHDTQEAAGWITKHGHSIADWRAALRRYASTWNEIEKGKTTRQTGTSTRPPHRAGEFPEPPIELPSL
jgi:hypothetical protein